MRTVYTEKEFEQALKDRERRILAKGDVAERLRSEKKKNKKKAAAIGAATAAVATGVALAPLTGGLSAGVGVAIGAGLTIGTVTITAADLAVIFGGTIGIIGVTKGFRVTFNADGSVIVEPTYKDKKS